MKSAVFSLFLFFCVHTLAAQVVDEGAALATARAWWQEMRTGKMKKASVKNENAGTGDESAEGRKEITKKENGGADELRLRATTAGGYLFAADEGFVIVAKDGDAPEILGYGFNESAGNIPDALRIFLSRAGGAIFYPPTGAEWRAVAPLLTTVRHQEAPYNNLCPYYLYDDGTLSATRCVVGCVATAMEQILTYYRREYVLADTLHGWQTEHYAVEDVLPGERVDSRLILDNYDGAAASQESVEAVARLSYWLGVAAQMNWGVEESGAHSASLKEPLERAFGLPYVNVLDSYKYDPAAYWQYLAAEVMAGRPVYYAGYLMRGGGHAFVIDGLDEDGLFHVNWGYGGSYDGYYRLDVLAHTQPEFQRKDVYTEAGFFCNQEAITLCPDAVEDVTPPDTLCRTGQEVVIESVDFLQKPVSGCATRLRVAVRNTANASLTTPFAFLLGLPTDTAALEQSDWVAYSGRTLAAGQRDTLLVDAVLSREGDCLLHITPNGEQIIFTLPVSIEAGGTKEISTAAPIVTTTSSTTAVVEQTFYNEQATDRAAQYFEYDLTDELTQASRSIIRYVYLEPQESRTESVAFAELIPGHTYTFRLRRRWPVVQTQTFTMPAADGVAQPTIVGEPSAWFTLGGQRIARPTRQGVYIKVEGGKSEKIIFNPSR